MRLKLPRALHVQSFALACLAFGGLPLPPLMADEPPSDAEADSAQAFQAHARQTAAGYALRTGDPDGRELTLVAEPVLRWTNPLGGRKAHGDVFVWTDAGRPAAVLSLYEFTSPEGAVREHHEFCSLATGRLSGDGPDERDWSPSAAGATVQPLMDAPEPASSAIRRLSQMRDLAARFRGTKTTREDQEERDLRLLPKPLLRYDSMTHDVADGGLFALVEATDPEILLMMEARPRDGKLQWHYALARLNSLRLAANYQERQVWEADVLKWGEVLNRRDQAYMIFLVR